jgi:hypothetical protein
MSRHDFCYEDRSWEGSGDLYQSRWAKPIYNKRHRSESSLSRKKEAGSLNRSFGSYGKQKTLTKRGLSLSPRRRKSGKAQLAASSSDYGKVHLDRVKHLSNPVSKSGKCLNVRTDIPTQERPTFDDSRDVIMGENTPVEMQSYVLITLVKYSPKSKYVVNLTPTALFHSLMRTEI